MMTEMEYVLSHFEERFRPFQGKRICLCGQGSYTSGILERFDSVFGFCGVIDPFMGENGEPAGRNLAPEAVLDGKIDLVILSEHKKTGEQDYVRMEGLCRSAGVLLYNMYGTDEIAVHDELEEGRRIQSSVFWQKMLESYETVSVCAMDTLFYVHELPSGERILEPNDQMVRFIKDLKNKGKRILFVSRHAVAEEQVRHALLQNGLAQNREELEKVLFFREGEDLSFRKMRLAYPAGAMAHIGTSPGNDGVIPRGYGIRTFLYSFQELRPWFTLEDLYPERAAHIKKEQVRLEREDVIRKIRQADLVSFDVFDTLLERKTLFPEDVFDFAAEKLDWDREKREAFRKWRHEARSRVPELNREQLYRWIAEHTDLTQEELSQAWHAEWETEKQVTGPRVSVVSLLREAQEMGKKIVLLSDMYLDSSLIRELLNAAGITGYSDLVVSCEYGMGKRSGLMQLLRAYGIPKDRILHIGDNAAADLEPALAAGYHAQQLPAARERAMQLPRWREAILSAKTPGERALTGMAVSAAFSDPFKQVDYAALDMKERLARYAQTAASPVILGHLCSIAAQCREKAAANIPYDGVLFSSRDGYLPVKLYEKARMREPSLPKGYYFYTSRKAAGKCAASKMDDYSFMLQKTGIQKDDAKLLHAVFGLGQDQIMPKHAGESREGYVMRHREMICRISEETMKNFRAYCQKEKLKVGGRYLLMDFVSEGTVFNLLEKTEMFHLDGSFIAYPIIYAEKKEERIRYFLSARESAFLQNYIEMEAILTAPHASVDTYAADGTPVFLEEGRNASQLRQMAWMQENAKIFMESFLEKFGMREDLGASCCGALYAADVPHEIPQVIYDDWAQQHW